MKSKSNKKLKLVQKPSLRSMLAQNKKIKVNVENSASELSSVNEVLKQGHKKVIPVETMLEAINQNENVEQQVMKAADDLQQVNNELAREVAERKDVEAELIETQETLAEVRDDLSKSQAKEEETREFALQDALTGLPNRVLFEQVLEQSLIQAKRHAWGLALLFIDIDKFKRFNDEFGHDLGDKVLRRVAKHLKSTVRKEDMVSRWGGDEFVCLMLEVKQAADAIHLAEKMVNRIAEVWESDGAVLPISISIGIAIYPAAGETAEILFKKADRAMYAAKRTATKVVLFDEAVFPDP